jgi:molybdopterin molybdotransferase
MEVLLSYREAREKVVKVVEASPHKPKPETVGLREAFGRVLAEPVFADRDYPPFHRSTRDGFAVRAADAASPGARLACIGEIRAGGSFEGSVGAGQCVEIMTGAAVPPGADAVVMVEHTRRDGNTITLERAAQRGQNIVPQGQEAAANGRMLSPGARMGYVELALAAQVGKIRLGVWARPRVAILSTGDEVVDVDSTPGPRQIRNSNGLALETLVTLGGGEAVQLGNAPDDREPLRQRIERGLQEDMLVLSGGVSMGKYDLVEQVLADMGAKFHFTGVALRPGRPAVFTTCHEKPVFGLPGNPVSTMVTFELFVLPAMDLLGGAAPRPLPTFRAKLAAPVDEKPPLAHFVPARIEWNGCEARVTQLPWHGSGDVVTLASANGFLVVGPERFEYAAGDWVDVLPRRGAL